MKDITWDKEYDVVVAGYGGAGISAAVTAHDNGASVVILEKAPFPAGGQTGASALGATYAIDPERAAEYLYAASCNDLKDADTDKQVSVVSLEDCRIFMEELARNPDWLTEMGVSHSVRKTSPVEFSKFPGADAFGHIVMRGWGAQFHETMKQHLEKRGIEVMYATPATRLIQNPATGEIIGAYAESNGKKIAVKARKGVVLCTGGFEFDEEMKANYLRPFPLKFAGWPYNTGDGIKMAQRVGADLWHMNTMVGYLAMWVPDYKPAFLLVFGRGIWVNRYGKRYMDEGNNIKSHNWWLQHLDYSLEEPGYTQCPTYLIFDETIRKRGPISGNSASGPGYRLGIQSFPAELGGCPEGWSDDNMQEIEKGWIKKGDTIEELGRAIGREMNPATLTETVKTYNGYCNQGHDPEFGRDIASLKALETPPFYALPLYPGGINTLGGPRRNAYGQVLDPYKEPIPRLYSAGEMGSICGNIYAIGGLNAGEMLASGRLAGKSVAALNNWD